MTLAFHDKTLGEFAYYADASAFYGETVLLEKLVELELDETTVSAAKIALDRMKELLSEIVVWDNRLRIYLRDEIGDSVQSDVLKIFAHGEHPDDDSYLTFISMNSKGEFQYGVHGGSFAMGCVLIAEGDLSTGPTDWSFNA